MKSWRFKMKITKIRLKTEDGLKKLSSPNAYELESLQKTIEHHMQYAGFITEVTILNSSSIKVGMHMRSFRINTEKLGYNADTGRFARTLKKGYKRTAIPTLDERVKFNHIINDALDHFEMQANVKSGDITVRYFEHGRVNEWNHYTSAFGERCFYEIVKETEMLKTMT